MIAFACSRACPLTGLLSLLLGVRKVRLFAVNSFRDFACGNNDAMPSVSFFNTAQAANARSQLFEEETRPVFLLTSTQRFPFFGW